MDGTIGAAVSVWVGMILGYGVAVMDLTIGAGVEDLAGTDGIAGTDGTTLAGEVMVVLVLPMHGAHLSDTAMRTKDTTAIEYMHTTQEDVVIITEIQSQEVIQELP